MQTPNDLDSDSSGVQKELADKNETKIIFEQLQEDDGSRQVRQGQDQSIDATQSISQNGDISLSQAETQETVKEEVSDCLDSSMAENQDKSHQVAAETINSISVVSIEASIVNNVGSTEPSENHSNSIQIMREEPDSNSQLHCSTPGTKSAIEQQQPVDNGVA